MALFNITYKLLIDIILIWTIFLMNIIFIGMLLLRNKVQKNEVNRSFFFLTLMHLPNGLVVLPVKFIQQMITINKDSILTLEYCRNLMTMVWLGIQSTTLAGVFFCLYHLYLINPSVKELYSNKFYRVFLFGVVMTWLIGSALITFNFTFYYSDIKFNTCVLRKSVTASAMLLVTVFAAPYTLCLVCYLKIIPTVGWVSDMSSMSRISSLQKESHSTVNTDHDSQGKYKWNRIFDFSKRSSRLSDEEKLEKDRTLATNVEFSSSESTKSNSPSKNNNEFNQMMIDPILEKKITKLLHIEYVKTNKNKYSKSSAVIGAVIISYFVLWTPFMVVILVEMMSRKFMGRYISWTIRVGYCNSIALPIIFVLFLKLYKSERRKRKR